MRILIIRLTSMGDVLFNLSVIADVKKNLPQASIDWVVDEEFGSLVQAHNGIERVFKLPIRRIAKATSLTSKIRDLMWLIRTLLNLRKIKYQYVIDTQGVIKSGIVSFFSRGQQKWSYTRAHLEAPGIFWIYSHHQEPSRELPAVYQYRKMIGEILGYSPDFSATEFLFSSATNIYEKAFKGQKKALLVPFSSKEKKQLSNQDMGQIARMLRQRGLSITLVAGSESERELGEKIAAYSECAIDTVFRPMEHFDNFRFQLPKFSMCIGVDTGITHISAAFGIPTAGIFSTSEIETYGPHHWARNAISLNADDSELMPRIEQFITQHSDTVDPRNPT